MTTKTAKKAGPMMAVTVNIPEEHILDTLVSAFEGGIGYWAELDDTWGRRRKWDGRLSMYTLPLTKDGAIVLREKDPDEAKKGGKLILDRIAIGAGLALLLNCTESPGRHAGAFLSGDGDNETADVFVQLCLFGKIKYG